MAGVFLACGSVNDPAKEYHLEFTVPEEELSEELVNLLRDIGVHAKNLNAYEEISEAATTTWINFIEDSSFSRVTGRGASSETRLQFPGALDLFPEDRLSCLFGCA